MKTLFMAMILGLALVACKKEGKDHPCYNGSIVHNGACPADCPGFKGCDGKTYCNECEAARHGIGPK